MLGHLQEYHPFVNVAVILISSIPFLAKGGTQPHQNIMSIRLKKVCKDVRVKLQLQQLTGEYLQNSTAAGNEVRLD